MFNTNQELKEKVELIIKEKRALESDLRDKNLSSDEQTQRLRSQKEELEQKVNEQSIEILKYSTM